MFSLMLILIFGILILPGIKIKKEPTGLSIDESSALKGLLCLTIFFHHFSGWFTELDPVLYFISHCGSFVVSVFFFLSAYGLSKSPKMQKQTLKDLAVRVLKLFVPFWVIEILYIFFYHFTGINISLDLSLKNILLSTLNLYEIISFSWFVSTIVFLYCVLFVVRKLPVNNYILPFFIILAVCSLFVSNLWITYFAFPVGLLISKKEECFLKLKNKQYILWIGLLLIGTAIFVALKYIASMYDYQKILDRSADAFSGVFFAVIVYLLFTRIHIGNKILDFLGKISYEFYLVHGLGIWVANKFFDISQPFYFFGAALIFNLFVAFAVNKFCAPICRKISKI